MSISSLTTLGAARDVRAPSKQDAGRKKADHAGAEDRPSPTDLLVTQVPTEIVAPYTALMAIVAGQVAKPTATNLHPDQLTDWRWGAFALLIFATAYLVWTRKKSKGSGSPNTNKAPIAEVVGATGVAVGWAFALPDSPLTPYLHSSAARTITPPFIAFAALVFAYAVGLKLTEQRRQ